MMIGIFANCITDGFARSIESLSPGHEIFRYTVQLAREATEEQLRIAAAELAACDVVFSLSSITSAYGPLAPKRLAEVCNLVVPIPMLAFTGLQPDCHYIRTRQGDLRGPMGPYHSAIAAASFLHGLSIDRTAALFNAFTYASLGYLSPQAVEHPLVNDAAEFGYDFSDFLQGCHGNFMHTINHPCINIIKDCAKQALAKADIGIVDNDDNVRDLLSESYQWPLYPEIGEALLGDFQADIQFRRGASGTVDLERFIEMSFEAYKKYPSSADIASSQIVSVQKFLTNNLR